MAKATEELMEEHRVIERMLNIVGRACDRLEQGGEVDREVFAGAAEFFRNFADKCHHGKEESLLFEKMVERGMSKTQGPIAVMLSEHDTGRAHVRQIAQLSGRTLYKESKEDLVKHGRAYVGLLSAHIQKEDGILYPMADRILTEDDQRFLERGFEDVEEKIMGPGVHEKYHKMIEEWEEKLA